MSRKRQRINRAGECGSLAHLICQTPRGFLKRYCHIKAQKSSCLQMMNPLLKSDGVEIDCLIVQRDTKLTRKSINECAAIDYGLSDAQPLRSGLLFFRN